MGNIAPAFITVNPSYVMPEILLPYSQASGAFDLLPGGEPLTRLGQEDLVAYVKRADVRTKIAAGQSAYNELPSCDVVMSYISVPSYNLRVRAEYDYHDTANMARWGVSIVEAQRLGMRQGHFQFLRTMLLNGVNPANGEGFLNAVGVSAVNLPPDTNGNDTVLTYDNGQMALFLLQQILNIKTRTNQLGMAHRFTILGPQRTLGAFEYNIVQLVQFQRAGAGSDSTKGTLAAILEMNQDDIDWAYDDTLIGAGAGETDAVIITMPEVKKPEGTPFNTNEFANLAPGLQACSLMLNDMSAPREITTPLAGGVTDVLSELRSTPGWPVRPEATTIVSMQYS